MTYPSTKTWPGRNLFPGRKRKGKPPKGLFRTIIDETLKRFL